MSHKLEMRDGKASFVSAREVPWHRLGELVDHTMKASEAIKKARLDWEVKTTSVYVRGLNDTMQEVPNKNAIYRDDPETGEPFVFAVKSERYTPIQNAEAFDFLDDLVEEADGAHYETAGALGHGERVFLTVKMPDAMTIDPKGAADQIQPYILVTNSHDGSRSFQVAVTPIRVVCFNTLNMALAKAQQSWKTSHTSNVSSRLVQAKQSLGLTTKYLEEMLAQAEDLIQQNYSKSEFQKMTRKIFTVKDDAGDAAKRQLDEKFAKLDYLFNEAPTQENIRGTKWAAFNAVGEFMDWERPMRGDDNSARLAKDSLFGSPIRIKNKTLALLGGK